MVVGNLRKFHQSINFNGNIRIQLILYCGAEIEGMITPEHGSPTFEIGQNIEADEKNVYIGRRIVARVTSLSITDQTPRSEMTTPTPNIPTAKEVAEAWHDFDIAQPKEESFADAFNEMVGEKVLVEETKTKTLKFVGDGVKLTVNGKEFKNMTTDFMVNREATAKLTKDMMKSVESDLYGHDHSYSDHAVDALSYKVATAEWSGMAAMLKDDGGPPILIKNIKVD